MPSVGLKVPEIEAVPHFVRGWRPIPRNYVKFGGSCTEEAGIAPITPQSMNLVSEMFRSWYARKNSQFNRSPVRLTPRATKSPRGGLRRSYCCKPFFLGRYHIQSSRWLADDFEVMKV